MASTADTAITEAWERRKAAFHVYTQLPFNESGDGKPYTPEEDAQCAIIDAAEETIRTAQAATPEGLVIQLWTCLSHGLTGREDEAAALRRDLAYFESRDEDLDWTDRLLLAAIRSAEAMRPA